VKSNEALSDLKYPAGKGEEAFLYCTGGISRWAAVIKRLNPDISADSPEDDSQHEGTDQQAEKGIDQVFPVPFYQPRDQQQ
jgi:hypothetical protein